jgi:hypothetical protein
MYRKSKKIKWWVGGRQKIFGVLAYKNLLARWSLSLRLPELRILAPWYSTSAKISLNTNKIDILSCIVL